MPIDGDNDPNILNGTPGDDEINGMGGDDTIAGVGGNDEINGGDGDDTVNVDVSVSNGVSAGGSDTVDGGSGDDVVNTFTDGTVSQVRLTFVSAQVGNGDASDLAGPSPQDGGLAVRFQAEDNGGALVGALSRYDDEGVTFNGQGSVTFDVRDLLSGAIRGQDFDIVQLGTVAGDMLGGAVAADENYYVNAGQGNDTVETGGGNDFLVGGAGDDLLTDSGGGNDSAIGGGGNDTISLGSGDDVIAAFNVTTDGADSVNLGEGLDLVNVAATAATNVRVTFTSAEVGNNNANDGGVVANNQDGGLAIRLQAETGGAPAGPVSRFDDEGITLLGGGGVTFDVRDLVSGAARGEAFNVVTLGTNVGDELSAVSPTLSYYFNGGQGNDTISGAFGQDFLVGGAGDDTLTDTFATNDTAIGGGGADVIELGDGVDLIAAFNITTDGPDTVNLGAGSDVFNVSATAATNVRVTFTSAEVGNGSAVESGLVMGQDGGLAVRLQAESEGSPGGAITRVDDEGITFVGGPGVTFDVRDIGGVGRGQNFEVVTLGASAAETLTAVQESRSYYFNAGLGNDTVLGGTADDFLVGGGGDDLLAGGRGDDSFLGGGGNDSLIGNGGNDSLDGGDGNDDVNGRVGNDTLIGGNGADTLTGSTGANRLIGGAGKDTMFAGDDDDVDTFVFNAASDSTAPRAGRDVILNFDSGEDVIDLTALGLTDFDQVQINTRADGVTFVFVDVDDDGVFDEATDFGLQFNAAAPVESDFLI